MQQTIVKASLGRETGSRASRRLRAEGRLPGVIYGLGKDPQPVSVEYTGLRAVLSTSAGMNALFTLEIDGNPETVLVKDVQRDPIRRVVTHADFLRVDPDRKVRVRVPIELIGEATNVTEAGGMTEQKLFEVEVEVSPGEIPEHIQGDLSIMTLDRRLAISDLIFPPSAVCTMDEEIAVVVPVVSRAAKVGARGEAEDGELDEVEDGADEGADAAADEEE